MDKTARKQPAVQKKVPPARAYRTLFFDREDITLLAKRLRNRFYEDFTRGFRMDFHYGGDSLSFSPERPLTPVSARRALKGLAVSPRLIEMAVSAIEGQAKEGFPRPDHVRFDLWFGSLTGESFAGDQIKQVVAATPANFEKWNRRLRKCGRTWDNITLSDEAIIRVTQRLFEAILKTDPSEESLRKRLRRWKNGAGRVRAHGYGVYTASPRALDDP